jgi:hypothetical protein
MRKSVIILLAATLILSSCGGWRDSRANPRNWFGSSSSTPVASVDAQGQATNPLVPQKAAKGAFSRPDAVDLSVPIQIVSELTIEPTPAGAIVRATGLAQRQGAYGAVLRAEQTDPETDKGVLSFTFRVIYPQDATIVGSERTRMIYAARTLSRKELQGISTIRVKAETNIRESRRK